MSEWADKLVTLLSPRAKRLIRLIALGHPQGEAALMTCYSKCRASQIMCSQLGQDYLMMLEHDVNHALVEENAVVELDIKKQALERIKEEIPESVERLCDLRDNAPPAVMLGATTRLLDMAGLTVKNEVAVSGVVVADPGVIEAMNRLTAMLQPSPQATEPLVTAEPKATEAGEAKG